MMNNECQKPTIIQCKVENTRPKSLFLSLLFFLIIFCVICFFPVHSALSETKASTRIHTFGQKNYAMDSVTVGSKTYNLKCGTDHLSANGCCTFTYAHAIQWMLGIEETTWASQCQLLEELLRITRTPWDDGNTKYSEYIKTVYSAISVTPTKSETWMDSHFTKNGVIIGHLKWNAKGESKAGGHFFLIIGGINHGGTYYLHVLDSNCGSTVKRVQCYDFSSFNTLSTSTANGVLDYWIPMNKFDETYRSYNGWSAQIFFDGAYYSNMSAPSTLEFRNIKYPATYLISSSGFNLSSGLIMSNRELTSLDAWIENSNGDKISQMTSAYPIAGHFFPIKLLDGNKDSNGQSVDMGQKFSKIENQGIYYWVLVATDDLGRTITTKMTINAVPIGSTKAATESKIYEDEIKATDIFIGTGPDNMANPPEAVSYYGLGEDGEISICATIWPDNATNKHISFSCSDDNILKYKNTLYYEEMSWATYTQVGLGTVTITASTQDGSGKSASQVITLFPDEFNLNNQNVTVNVGSSVQLVPNVNPIYTTNYITWESYSEYIARVDENGVVMGVSPGIATICAKLNYSDEVKAICTVTVLSDDCKLDLNGYLDGIEQDSLYEYGTADVYINGSLVADDVFDYCTSWPRGTTYEITDIKAAPGYQYDGVYNGSLSGTIGEEYVDIRLSFSTKSYRLDLNGCLDGEPRDGLYEYGTADVYINGSLVADDVSDYCTSWPHGTTYEIKDIKPSAGYQYNGVYSGSLAGTINAAEVMVYLNFSRITSGICGDNATWSYQNGTLTISGSGRMYDYDYDAPWKLFRDSITTIVVENGITYTGQYSFYLCNAVTSVSLPETLTSLGYGTLEQCTSLKTVTLPSSLTDMGGSVFYVDSALTSIVIPSGVTQIGRYSFFGCSNLTAVTIPNGVTKIAEYAFNSCEKLVNLTIPTTVTTIEDAVFDNCPLLNISCWAHTTAHSYAKENNIPYKLLDTSFGTANVTFPSTTRQIKAHALRNTKARRVMVPEGVTAIGSGAFENCKQLQDIFIPQSCGSIAADAFSGVTDLVIYGRAGSYAETYAQQYGFDFVALSGQ